MQDGADLSSLACIAPSVFSDSNFSPHRLLLALAKCICWRNAFAGETHLSFGLRNAVLPYGDEGYEKRRKLFTRGARLCVKYTPEVYRTSPYSLIYSVAL
ncbi:MAG: hypothetical protein CL681_12825 [Blastopirellula sp.]|nr:hypothetical protein [Blastopirellula sp.]